VGAEPATSVRKPITDFASTSWAPARVGFLKPCARTLLFLGVHPVSRVSRASTWSNDTQLTLPASGHLVFVTASFTSKARRFVCGSVISNVAVEPTSAPATILWILPFFSKGTVRQMHGPLIRLERSRRQGHDKFKCASYLLGDNKKNSLYYLDYDGMVAASVRRASLRI